MVLPAWDSQREAGEHSVLNRLPDPQIEAADVTRDSHHAIGTEPALCDHLGKPGCDHPSCAGDCRQYSCHCGCYPCECPLAEAPFIECPRGSTLSPYFNISFFGALKLDMLFNSARPIAAGTPFFLAPGSLAGLDQNTFDMHARQTTLGAAFTGPRSGDFQSGGLVIAMFYNDAVIVDRYGFLPLQAYGELRNQDWRFAAGLQFDAFAPGLPTVLPFSALAATGNAGNSFRGQVRLERFFYPSADSQWTLQFALSEPITTTIDPDFGLNEDNGWPNLEGRIAWSLGPVEGTGAEAKRLFEIGVSGLVGQIRTTRLNALTLETGRVVADVWGLSSDFRWKINDIFGVLGEVYAGQTLGNYNGEVLQGVNVETLEGIRSTGGWLEAFVYVTPCLHNHTGYAIGDPVDDDVATVAPGLARTWSSTFYSNLIWDLNRTFRVAFKFTYRQTNYFTPGVPNNEGAGFHTQFQWAF